MDAVKNQKLISAYQSTLDGKKLEEFNALPAEKKLEVIQTQKFAATDLGALSNLESKTTFDKKDNVFPEKPIGNDESSGLVLERTTVPFVNAKFEEPKKVPKTTNYVVQLGDKIEDVVKKSLVAQGKEVNEANIKEATEKLKKDNHEFVRTSNKGDYLLAGKTIKVDGEIEKGSKTAEEVETEYLKKHPKQESKTYTDPETKLKTTDTYNEDKTIIMKRVTKDNDGTVTVYTSDNESDRWWTKAVETQKDGTISVYTGDNGSCVFQKKEVTKKGQKTEVYTFDNAKNEWVNNQSEKVVKNKADTEVETKSETKAETKSKTGDTQNVSMTAAETEEFLKKAPKGSIKRVAGDYFIKNKVNGNVTQIDNTEGKPYIYVYDKNGNKIKEEHHFPHKVEIYNEVKSDGTYNKKTIKYRSGNNDDRVDVYTGRDDKGNWTKGVKIEKGKKPVSYTWDGKTKEWVEDKTAAPVAGSPRPAVTVGTADKFAGKPTKRSYSEGSIKVEEHYDVNKKMTSKVKKYLSGDVLTESYKNGALEKKELKTKKSVTTFANYVDGKATKTTRIENGEKLTYDNKENKWVKDVPPSATKKVNEPKKPTPKKGQGVVITPDKYGNKTIETYKNGILFQKEIIHKDGSKEFYDGYNPTQQGTYDFVLKKVTDKEGHSRFYQRNPVTGKYPPIR